MEKDDIINKIKESGLPFIDCIEAQNFDSENDNTDLEFRLTHTYSIQVCNGRKSFCLTFEDGCDTIAVTSLLNDLESAIFQAEKVIR